MYAGVRFGLFWGIFVIFRATDWSKRNENSWFRPPRSNLVTSYFAKASLMAKVVSYMIGNDVSICFHLVTSLWWSQGPITSKKYTKKASIMKIEKIQSGASSPMPI